MMGEKMNEKKFLHERPEKISGLKNSETKFCRLRGQFVETNPPPLAGKKPKRKRVARERIRELKASLLAGLPTVDIDGQTWWVDRVGVVYVGRMWSIAEPPCPKEIELAIRWFTEARPIGTPNVSSYTLKHCIERRVGTYISNGSAIIGAARRGFRMTVKGGPAINPLVALSKKWLKTRPERDPLTWTRSREYQQTGGDCW